MAFFPVGAVCHGQHGRQPGGDVLAEALARRRLADDGLMLYRHGIEVSSIDGAATPAGSARNREARDALARQVGKVSGVASVKNLIDVEPNP